MTEQEQRIAIAEACGLDVKICPIHHEQECCGRYIPNYLHDLNAMHEAEDIILVTSYQKADYGSRLAIRFGGWCYDALHASAAQRAEYILKTIGKWKD